MYFNIYRRERRTLLSIFFACLFFFLMIRRPPRSTLSLHDALPIWTHLRGGGEARDRGRQGDRAAHARSRRSEEHTSEFQSHSDIVCRLLLEQKKKLQPAVHLKRKAQIAMQAAMVQRMQLFGIEIDAAFTVADERVVFPTFPEACGDVVNLQWSPIRSSID